jgi:asparagine synthase (glutamine-hydrolysing)
MVRAALEAAVRSRLESDVPLGAFLSGGIDSSAVVTFMSRALAAPPHTYSVAVPDSVFLDEAPMARLLAKELGTVHREIAVDAAGLQSEIPAALGAFGEPFADSSAIPCSLIAREARRTLTVALSGDGGDEVFGGYRTYRRFARYERWPTWPRFMESATFALRRPFHRRHAVSRALTLLETALSGGPDLWARIMGGMPAAAKSRYRAELGIPRDYDDWWHYREHWRADLPVRTRLQLVDFHTFLPGLVLTKVDRTSMAVSLEARVPLLDRRIIEFSFALDEELRYHGGETKGLLRHAYRGILPDGILDRR